MIPAGGTIEDMMMELTAFAQSMSQFLRRQPPMNRHVISLLVDNHATAFWPGFPACSGRRGFNIDSLTVSRPPTTPPSAASRSRCMRQRCRPNCSQLILQSANGCRSHPARCSRWTPATSLLRELLLLKVAGRRDHSRDRAAGDLLSIYKAKIIDLVARQHGV